MQNFKKVTIGRDAQCIVVLSDPSVSRVHAELFLDNEGNAFLTDMNSSNGTLVNGSRIKGTVQLKMGDTVHLGKAQFNWESETQGIVKQTPSQDFDFEKNKSATQYNKRNLLVISLGVFSVIVCAVIVVMFWDEGKDEADHGAMEEDCISVLNIIDDNGSIGMKCCDCDFSDEFTTKSGKVVVIKGKRIDSISKKEEKIEENPHITTEKEESDTESDNTSMTDPPNKGYLSRDGKWVAGKNDVGVAAMTENINNELNKEYSEEDLRIANDLHGQNPPITAGKKYNLPQKK